MSVVVTFLLSMLSGVWKAIQAAMQWALKNPGLFLGLLAVTAVGMVVISKNREINSLRTSINNPKDGYVKRIADLKAALQQSRDNADTMEAAIKQQNAGIAAVAAKQDAADAAFQKVIAGQATTQKKLDRQLTYIGNAKSTTGNECADLGKLIKGAVE